ncbi:MAG TPA: serine/threonine-protein phosphatase [Firmicutes bacterium]|nr:serine/threonine-protein phosphatase [Candidatus Fermentithermobacillaceae bacterium]
MHWDAKSLPGLVRSKNEDAWLVRRIREKPDVWFLAVADGMGGFEGGEFASKLAIQTCYEYLVRTAAGCDGGEKGAKTPAQEVEVEDRALRSLPEALENGVKKANEVVYKEALELFGYPGMGTTLTAALIHGNDLYVSHVGDSRAYLISSGVIKQVSEDHSIVGELVKNGAISEDEAMRHPQRHILTLALGTEADLPVSSYRERLKDGDVVVLCTDGLTTLVSSSEILEAVKTKPRSEISSFLVDLANSRGGYDNITLVVFWVDTRGDPEVNSLA